LKKNKITQNLKKEILKPTKIYSNEILRLNDKNLIKAGAHITGGGLVENLLRSVPDSLTLNIDLSKIKTLKIFKWLKSKNISDEEMLKTFNCGVGFCLIVKKKNIHKIKRFFSKKYMPYEIGFISKDKSKINISNSVRW
jgi:phosphoribosylaminoimidazole (AIR) synthetase